MRQPTVTKIILLLLTALLSGCAGINTIVVLPEHGLKPSDAKLAIGVVDKFALNRGFVRNEKNEQFFTSMVLTMYPSVLVHDYTLQPPGISMLGPSEIRISAGYVGETFSIGVNDSTQTSSSSMTRRYRDDLANQLADVFGRSRIVIRRNDYIDPR